MPVSKSKRTRYIPPAKPKPKPSPRWIPVLMMTFIAIGVLMLIAYYTGLLPGGSPLWGLLGGFGFVAAGFFTGVFWR